MAYQTWKLEQEALENAFARRLLVEYNIKEVTTQRQAKNGTREFEFPAPARKRLPNGKRLKLACFKSGYVRNQNSGYSNYQLNKTYFEDEYFKDYDWKFALADTLWGGILFVFSKYMLQAF